MRAATLFLTLCLAAGAASSAQLATVKLIGGPEIRQFQVEVVDTPETRARGLMYRTELAPDAGMLFVFERPADVGFWMRNTYIPLDMIFIDRHARVVHIHHRAQPHDETMISPGQPITHVLEINGGLSEALGIEPGHRMLIDVADHPAE